MRDDTPQMTLAFPRLTPVVKALLVVIGASFVLVAIATRVLGAGLVEQLILDPSTVLEKPWTLVTYAIVHDLQSPWHVLFNCIAIYFFATTLEERWGGRRFALFALVTTLAGGLALVAMYALHLGAGAAIGASALAQGCVVAWGLLYPDREMFLYFFRVKGIHLVAITAGFVLLQALTSSGASVAVDVGGMLAGAAWASASGGPVRRWFLERKLRRLSAQKASLGRRSGASGLRVIPGGRDGKSKEYLN